MSALEKAGTQRHSMARSSGLSSGIHARPCGHQVPWVRMRAPAARYDMQLGLPWGSDLGFKSKSMNIKVTLYYKQFRV